MEHLSQKVSRLGNVRNFRCFRPVYDSNGVTPLDCLYRIRSSKGIVDCSVVGSPWIHFSLPSSLQVRCVFYSE